MRRPPVNAIRQAVAGVEPNQPVEALRVMDDFVEREAAPYRLTSMVIGGLTGVALTLALTGIYGQTAFTGRGRRRAFAGAGP